MDPQSDESHAQPTNKQSQRTGDTVTVQIPDAQDLGTVVDGPTNATSEMTASTSLASNPQAGNVQEQDATQTEEGQQPVTATGDAKTSAPDATANTSTAMETPEGRTEERAPPQLQSNPQQATSSQAGPSNASPSTANSSEPEHTPEYYQLLGPRFHKWIGIAGTGTQLQKQWLKWYKSKNTQEEKEQFYRSWGKYQLKISKEHYGRLMKKMDVGDVLEAGKQRNKEAIPEGMGLDQLTEHEKRYLLNVSAESARKEAKENERLQKYREDNKAIRELRKTRWKKVERTYKAKPGFDQNQWKAMSAAEQLEQLKTFEPQHAQVMVTAGQKDAYLHEGDISKRIKILEDFDERQAMFSLGPKHEAARKELQKKEWVILQAAKVNELTYEHCDPVGLRRYKEASPIVRLEILQAYKDDLEDQDDDALEEAMRYGKECLREEEAELKNARKRRGVRESTEDSYRPETSPDRQKALESSAETPEEQPKPTESKKKTPAEKYKTAGMSKEIVQAVGHGHKRKRAEEESSDAEPEGDRSSREKTAPYRPGYDRPKPFIPSEEPSDEELEPLTTRAQQDKQKQKRKPAQLPANYDAPESINRTKKEIAEWLKNVTRVNAKADNRATGLPHSKMLDRFPRDFKQRGKARQHKDSIIWQMTKKDFLINGRSAITDAEYDYIYSERQSENSLYLQDPDNYNSQGLPRRKTKQVEQPRDALGKVEKPLQSITDKLGAMFSSDSTIVTWIYMFVKQKITKEMLGKKGNGRIGKTERAIMDTARRQCKGAMTILAKAKAMREKCGEQIDKLINHIEARDEYIKTLEDKVEAMTRTNCTIVANFPEVKTKIRPATNWKKGDDSPFTPFDANATAAEAKKSLREDLKRVDEIRAKYCDMPELNEDDANSDDS